MNSNSHSQIAGARQRQRNDGVALVIVLAFVVLVTGVVVAFFSRAMTERQVSNSSSNITKADILAQSAADIIVADLKQEIVNGSTATAIGSGTNASTLYISSSNTYMLPQRSGNPVVSGTDLIPNLVRISLRSDPIAAPGVASRASAVNSKTDASINGRIVSATRWNSHYLIPRDPNNVDGFGNANNNSRGTNPIPNFGAPDWVMISGTGPKVLTAPDSSVIGRYAYAIYDEGGLLDINAAGYPYFQSGPTTYSSRVPAAVLGSKANLGFADLTQVFNNGGQASITSLVGWRNFASTAIQPLPSPAATPGGGPLTSGFTFGVTAGAGYGNYMLSRTDGFLKVNPNPYVDTVNKIVFTDQAITSRQHLLQLQRAIGFSQDGLQYLTHFSRDLNQPSWITPQSIDSTMLGYDASAPKVLQDGGALFGGNNAFGGDLAVNPSFLQQRVTTAFTRNDSTPANIGEPLVIKRFALNRLAWITCKGPSADNLGDAIVTALKAQGVPLTLLQQGTQDNIYKYFGLSWDSTTHRWIYDHNSVVRPPGVPTPAKAGATSANIFTLANVTGREPDFFELLKATLKVGSLGKHGSLGRDLGQTGVLVTQGTKVQYKRDILVDMQIFNIGLNMIDQADPDNYPTRLLIWNPISTAPATRELAGVENLPYFHRFRNGVVRLTEASTANKPASTADNADVTKTGAAALLMYPELWNPHAANSPANGVDPQTERPSPGWLRRCSKSCRIRSIPTITVLR